MRALNKTRFMAAFLAASALSAADAYAGTPYSISQVLVTRSSGACTTSPGVNPPGVSQYWVVPKVGNEYSHAPADIALTATGAGGAATATTKVMTKVKATDGAAVAIDLTVMGSVLTSNADSSISGSTASTGNQVTCASPSTATMSITVDVPVTSTLTVSNVVPTATNVHSMGQVSYVAVAQWQFMGGNVFYSGSSGKSFTATIPPGTYTVLVNTWASSSAYTNYFQPPQTASAVAGVTGTFKITPAPGGGQPPMTPLPPTMQPLPPGPIPPAYPPGMYPPPLPPTDPYAPIVI
jgi:hypothetical protein